MMRMLCWRCILLLTTLCLAESRSPLDHAKLRQEQRSRRVERYDEKDLTDYSSIVRRTLLEDDAYYYSAGDLVVEYVSDIDPAPTDDEGALSQNQNINSNNSFYYSTELDQDEPAEDCNRTNVEYVSRDPNRCAAIRFACNDDRVPFFNECGCGCEPPLPPFDPWIVFSKCQVLPDTVNVVLPDKDDDWSIPQVVLYQLCSGCDASRVCTGGYVLDLVDYLTETVNFQMNRQQEYCNACDNECYNNSITNGRRRRRQLIQNVDCDTCLDECEKTENMEENGYIDATEFIECSKIYDFDDDSKGGLYAGPVCADNGDRIRLAVFLDENCQILDPSRDVNDYLINKDGNRLSLSYALLNRSANQESCVSCSTDNLGGVLCQDLYEWSAKCDTEHNDPDTCQLMDDILTGQLDCEDGEDLNYIGDSGMCALIGDFLCDKGQEQFFNECGCGCKDISTARMDCTEGPGVEYVGDLETCTVIEYVCDEGQTDFSDSCGCGCKPLENTVPSSVPGMNVYSSSVPGASSSSVPSASSRSVLSSAPFEASLESDVNSLDEYSTSDAERTNQSKLFTVIVSVAALLHGFIRR